MSTTVIAGKSSNTVGNKDSTLVLRGSSIKILWGNKFIDLIKNGKINVDSDKILKTTDSVESITSDGIYLVGESVWAVIGGTKIQLAGDSATTYVSYLVALETTSELKKQALTNIGFYYDTYEQALNSGLTTGIVYVLGDNKLYIIKEGVLLEYMSNTSSVKDTPLLKLYISEYSLMVDGEEYSLLLDNTIYLRKLVSLENGLKSRDATSSQGFRLYTDKGKSYLEIDKVIERDAITEKNTILQVKYYLEDNIVLAINDNQLTLLNSDKYKVGDVLTTSVILEKQTETTNGIDRKNVLVEVEIVINSIIEEVNRNNIYNVTINLVTDDISLKNSFDNLQLINKILYYKLGSLPIARIKDGNYDYLESIDNYEEYNLSTINTRIGEIKDIIIENTTINEFYTLHLYEKNKEYGLYSKHSFLENSTLLNPNLFLSEEDFEIINTKIGNIEKIISDYQLAKYLKEDYNKKLGIYSDNAIFKDSYLINSEISSFKTVEDEEILVNKIGNIEEITIEGIEHSETGMYSNNAIFESPKLIKSEEYNTVFKDIGVEDISEKYPRYDNLLTLPENLLSLSQAIPSVGWIKQIIDILVPIGTIVMYYGETIPEGWAICNGENGTPDLRNRFIKGSGSVLKGTDAHNVVEVDEDNKLTLKRELLPHHIHTHNSHRHSISLSGNTDYSGNLTFTGSVGEAIPTTTTSKTQAVTPDYAGSGQPTKDFITSVNVTIENKTSEGSITGGNHRHSLSLSGNTGDTTTTQAEDTYTLTKINIEPRAFSLMFIMKIKNVNDL